MSMKIKNARAMLFTAVMIFILCFGHVGVMAEESWTDNLDEAAEIIGRWRAEEIEEHRFEGEWIFGGGNDRKDGLYAYHYDSRLAFHEIVDISGDTVDSMGKKFNGSTPVDAGDRVVYTSNRNLISVMKDGTSRIILEENFALYSSGQEVKAIGDVVYYLNARDEIWCTKADGTTRSERVTPDRRVVTLFFFIDGGYIYYQSQNDNNGLMEFYRIRTDGTGEEQLLHSGEEINIRYAKNGSVYYADRAVNGLMKMDSNGKNHMKIFEYSEGSVVSTVYGVSDKWLYFNFNNEEVRKVTIDGAKTWETMLGDANKGTQGINHFINIQVVGDTVFFQGESSYGFYKITPDILLIDTQLYYR
jgi:hypothetical protein